jgi:hypothetical protein
MIGGYAASRQIQAGSYLFGTDHHWVHFSVGKMLRPRYTEVLVLYHNAPTRDNKVEQQDQITSYIAPK